ncbi:hypothetical protein B0J12DRAFT_369924 [Macrophomina phaseolina]|uniref:Rhodopsin domain-containing protein n=1 Tax=Macrophomina phaseolina TaxID=35725 RepID=A0ABQ8GJS9_9PEZI|nr:hypothetical protein B0J12DRAFT_369924 [Macrophomina phaseolina]
MTEVHLEKDTSFLSEIWAWFVIGCVVIVLRYIVRFRTVGFRGFAGDDYVTILTLGFYTMDAALVHIVYHTGANADLTPATVSTLTESQISTFVYGSRCEAAAWYSYTALIWCMKFTMLFFYKRLTFGTLQNRLIKYLFWLCGVTYLAVFLTITFGCFPIQNNWAVRPLPGKQCTFKVQNLLVTVVLNIITDAALLVIPIPILWRLNVTLSRKLAIAALLSSGIFVICAAVIRAVLTLGEAPSALNINRWGVRETIIGLLTVNVPILRPLFSRAFWHLGPYRPSTSNGHSSGGGGSSAPWAASGGTSTGSKLGRVHRHHSKSLGRHEMGFELHSACEGEDDMDRASTYSKSNPSVSVARAPSNSGSEEHIVAKDEGSNITATRTFSRDLEAGDDAARLPMGNVLIETTYEIHTSQRSQAERLGSRGNGSWGRPENARGVVGYDSRCEAIGPH